jgi:hypothetical protein
MDATAMVDVRSSGIPVGQAVKVVELSIVDDIGAGVVQQTLPLRFMV